MRKRNQHRPVMVAPDMFNPRIKQTFDLQTGERISYGREFDPLPVVEPEPVIELKNIYSAQISLF